MNTKIVRGTSQSGKCGQGEVNRRNIEAGKSGKHFFAINFPAFIPR
jgi:hypothetical protein